MLCIVLTYLCPKWGCVKPEDPTLKCKFTIFTSWVQSVAFTKYTIKVQNISTETWRRANLEYRV